MTEIITPNDPRWLVPPQTDVSIIAGCALSKDSFTIAVSGVNGYEFNDFSRLYKWDAGTWIAADFEHYITDIIPYKDPSWDDVGYILLSQQGVVTYLGSPSFQETIPQAGIQQGRDAPVKYGTVNRVRSMGGNLCVVGSGGQFYERLDRAWTDYGGLLHKESRVGPLESIDPGGRVLGRPGFTIRDCCLLQDTEYLCGIETPFRGFMMSRRQGDEWREITLPERSDGLLVLYTDRPDELWCAGRGSVVLHGNATDGFRAIPADVDGLYPQSIARHRGHLYFGGSDGLLRLDGGRLSSVQTARPVSIQTGVGRPRVDDCQFLQVVDDVLWNFGYQGVQYFDGRDWHEIAIPQIVAD